MSNWLNQNNEETLQRIAELLFGYREVDNETLVEYLSQMVDDQKSLCVAARAKGSQLREIVSELNDAIEELEQPAADDGGQDE